MRIFRSIVLPLATPAIASFGIFQFIWVWNDLLVALTFGGGSPNVPMIVFFALQRYFVRGLLAGSVKG